MTSSLKTPDIFHTLCFRMGVPAGLQSDPLFKRHPTISTKTSRLVLKHYLHRRLDRFPCQSFVYDSKLNSQFQLVKAEGVWIVSREWGGELRWRISSSRIWASKFIGFNDCCTSASQFQSLMPSYSIENSRLCLRPSWWNGSDWNYNYLQSNYQSWSRWIDIIQRTDLFGDGKRI